MDEDIRLSRLRISRRRAMSIGGTVGLTGLLAACGGGSTTSAGAAATTAASTAAATSTAAPVTDDIVALLDKANTCTMAQEETQGPYWFDVDSIRADIREDRPGTAFTLAIRVQDMSRCTAGGAGTPVPNSVVEIWHCDAGGVYSGFESASTGGGGPRPGGGETSDGSYSAGDQEATPGDDGTYLRGAQVADSRGIVEFTTIYPGWYRGRTVHIHVKVHIDKKTVLTTQLYADDALTDQIYTAAPYDSHTGRETFNADDDIYDASGLMTVVQRSDGWLGVVNLGIDV